MAAWVYDIYARLLSYAGDAEMAARVRKSADAQRAAAARQWTGKWLRRAWLGPKLGWVGESTLWLEPQPWALLAGVTTPEQSRELVRNMDELLRRLSPIGAVQMNQGPDAPRGGIWEPGTSVSGGIWPSLNQTLVWALGAARSRHGLGRVEKEFAGPPRRELSRHLVRRAGAAPTRTTRR